MNRKLSKPVSVKDNIYNSNSINNRNYNGYINRKHNSTVKKSNIIDDASKSQINVSFYNNSSRATDNLESSSNNLKKQVNNISNDYNHDDYKSHKHNRTNSVSFLIDNLNKDTSKANGKSTFSRKNINNLSKDFNIMNKTSCYFVDNIMSNNDYMNNNKDHNHDRNNNDKDNDSKDIETKLAYSYDNNTKISSIVII